VGTSQGAKITIKELILLPNFESCGSEAKFMDFRNMKTVEDYIRVKMHPRVWGNAKTYSNCWSDSNTKTRKTTGKMN
jgi:hypothetical protein